MPAPGKAKLIKFPPSRTGKDVKYPGYARGVCLSIDLTGTLVGFQVNEMVCKMQAHSAINSRIHERTKEERVTPAQTLFLFRSFPTDFKRPKRVLKKLAYSREQLPFFTKTWCRARADIRELKHARF